MCYHGGMLVLAIETSCDETAVAILRHGREVLVNLVASQVDLHRRYGGIVPELASRRHMEVILPLTEEALSQAGLTLKDLSGLAVTNGPGLIGALVVGVSFAKALAFSTDLPLVAVDHLNAHFLAIFLEEEHPSFPFVALVVSGGHTALFYVESHLRYYLLGQTRDDAAGEAFDKVSKLLGLGYPGGRIISKLAEHGDPEAISLPRPMLTKSPFDFSFSGLKTAVVYYVRERQAKGEEIPLHDLCASFEAAVVEVLVKKAVAAVKATRARNLVVAGGVAANKRLRQALKEAAEEEGFSLFLPRPEYCTDNAAMVGVAGYHKLISEDLADLELDVYARSLVPKYSKI